MIKFVVAYDNNKLIGINDVLPWYIKEEANHFRETTWNKTILMGDVTFFGIGKVLPNRKTIILTLNKELKYNHPNVEICHDYMKIVKQYQGDRNNDIYVCGGREIFKLFMPFVDELIVSIISKEYIGNVYFPDWNEELFTIVNEKIYEKFTIKYYKKI